LLGSHPMSASSGSWLTRERLVVAGLLLFAAAIRGGVLWGMRENLQEDPDAYRMLAENLLAHGVYGSIWARNGESGKLPTAYRPPLYPIVLSNLAAPDGQHVSLGKVAVVHVLLGVATVWLTYLTARRVLASGARPLASERRPLESGGREPAEAGRDTTQRGPPQRAFPTAPLAAALLVACDPILLNQQTLVMTETLATLLAILSLWCLVRFSAHRYWWNAALAGGAIGLAALCRPTFLPWLGLVGLVMISDFRFLISDWQRWMGRSVPNLVALAVAAAAVMSPWVIRNQQELGEPILTTTHGGYTLLLGNNEDFYQWLRAGSRDRPWQSDVLDVTLELNALVELMQISPKPPDEIARVERELRKDALAYRMAQDAIRGQPRMFALACLYRAGQLWSPLPHKLLPNESTGRMLLRYLTAAWYCGVYLLAAVGVWRLRWRLLKQPWIWGVLLCLAFTAVHTLYWCNLRMRAPLMPFVALVAAAAVIRAEKPAV
jgi:hypothetical protein